MGHDCTWHMHSWQARSAVDARDVNSRFSQYRGHAGREQFSMGVPKSTFRSGSTRAAQGATRRVDMLPTYPCEGSTSLRDRLRSERPPAAVLECGEQPRAGRFMLETRATRTGRRPAHVWLGRGV